MIDPLGTHGVYGVIFVVVIAVASLVGLVIFASKEETFEDVVAAQRKEQEVLLQSLSANASKRSKSKKKWSNTKKEKSVKANDKKEETDMPEVISVHRQQIIEPDVKKATAKELKSAEVLKEHEEDKTKSKKGGKNKEKKKPISEKPVAPPEPPKKQPKVKVQEDIVEIIEDAMQEVPAMEAMAESEIANFLDEALDKGRETVNVEKEPKLEKKPKVEKAKAADSVLPQKKNKVKKAKQPADGSRLTVDKLTNDVASAQLDNSEVQQLIDALLHKQSELQQWRKPNQKGDPIEDLKKRVHELQAQLKEEKNTSLDAAKSNKELRHKLKEEQSRLQHFQSQSSHQLTQKAGEIQALQKRMEATHESHLREMQSSQAQLNQLKEMVDKSSSSSPELQRLKEENAMYKNASLKMQQLNDEKSALLTQCSQLRSELDSTNMQKHQQQMRYDEKIKAMENEIHSVHVSKGDSEKLLSNRLAEVNDQLRKSEADNKNLSGHLKHVQDELARSEKVKQEVLTKSAEIESSKALGEELERLKASLKTAEDKVKHQEQVDCQKDYLLKKITEEKQALEEKLKKEEIVLVEKQESNGDATDLGVSQEEYLQLSTEKDKIISELKEDLKSTKEELENLASVMKQEKEEKDGIIKGFEDNVKLLQENAKKQEETIEEKKAEAKKMEGIIESAKAKNNELREKNWKAMDALSTTEANSKKKIKDVEEAVFRTLKAIRPNINLEKGKPVDEVLKGFEIEFLKTDKKKKSRGSDSDSGSSSDSDSDGESKRLKNLRKEKESAENRYKELQGTLEDLKKEKSELELSLKKASSDGEKLKKLTEENKNANLQVKHYQEVLEETETMLKKLESSVESQVSSYEKKLQGKDSELKQLAEKVKRLEDEIQNNDDKSQLEADLKNIQTELESEKKAKLSIISELEEAKSKVIALEEAHENSFGEDSLNMSQESLDTSGSSSPKKKKGLRHALGKAFRKKSESTDEVKGKLVHAEEALAKLEADKKELSEKLGQISDSAKVKDKEIESLKHSKEEVVKENAKLKEKVKVIEDAASSAGGSDKQKDALIAKLKVENAELLEDLREERDRVVVDVESVDSEKLKSELESLQNEYQKERESASQLNTSKNELEEELLKTKSEFEELQKKYKETADKLVVSEQRSKDLELAGLTKSERIEKEIDEAIQSDNSPTSPQRAVGTPLVTQLDELMNQLTEKDQLLDNEKELNKQLRAQVAALSSDAAHGTSV